MITVSTALLAAFAFLLTLGGVVVGVAVAWGRLHARIEALVERHAQLQRDTERLETQLATLQRDVDKMAARAERDEKHADRTGGSRAGPLGNSLAGLTRQSESK